MPDKKGVVKHQSEKLVDKAKEKLAPEEPKREPQPAKKETVRLGVDNHLVDSLVFPVDGEKILVESVARGGSEVPKDKEAEIRRVAKTQGYQLAEVE